jgi:hypothetical protein
VAVKKDAKAGVKGANPSFHNNQVYGICSATTRAKFSELVRKFKSRHPCAARAPSQDPPPGVGAVRDA